MNKVAVLWLFGISVVLTGCVSRGPATQFYTLTPADKVPARQINTVLSLGIGPVVLPDYAQNPAVVSIEEGTRVRVSGHHAWAGSLRDASTRVLTNHFSRSLNSEDVEAFPWDTRARPARQLRLVFDQFGGQRGGLVRLSCRWALVETNSGKVHARGREHAETISRDEGVEAYIQSLNATLHQLSDKLVVAVSPHLSVTP